jgi:uncharacterized protein (TIGR00730 family)
MARLRSLCVYCGSSSQVDPAYREGAATLGRDLAAAGIALVFGGGQVGLMGIIANAALEAGGKVVGVIPRHLDREEVGHRGIQELHVVETMHERKALMFQLSDAFAVLPGGLGTMDETFEMITWRQLGLHDRPIVLVNQQGYWDPLLALLRHIADSGFAQRGLFDLFTLIHRIDEVIPTIRALPDARIPAQPHKA